MLTVHHPDIVAIHGISAGHLCFVVIVDGTDLAQLIRNATLTAGRWN